MAARAGVAGLRAALCGSLELARKPPTAGAADLLRLARIGRCIDARAPCEFARGHIPGARNVPLLSDEERAQIGLTYKQSGRAAAIELGFGLVGPRAEGLLHAAQAAAAGGEGALGVYCARGGLRSNLLALFCGEALGLASDMVVLDGGYKAWRRHALGLLEAPAPRVVVVGGQTGVGKTRILRALRERGEQVVDLEGLAEHLGSAFGRIGQTRPQPSTEHYANLLAAEWATFDPARPVFVEDEGAHVGQVQLPVELYQRVRGAGLVCRVVVPHAARVRNLVETYGKPHLHDDLASAVQRLGKRLGHQVTAQALADLDRGDFAGVASALLAYYDKRYDKHLLRDRSEAVFRLVDLSLEECASLPELHAKAAREIAALASSVPPEQAS